MDRTGQRLLHLLNVAPTPTTLALSYRDRPVLAGRRLRLDARAGLMLPYGIRVGDRATLVETTAELVARTGGTVVLRPTQEDVDIAVLETDLPVTTDRGSVQGGDGRTTVTMPGRAAGPVRLTVG